MNNFGKLKDLVMSLEEDFSKFYDKQNAAAGTRVRKGMQELKTMAQEFRTEVQNTKNAGAGAGAAGGAKKATAGAAGGAKKATAGAAGGAAKKAAPAKKK
jgi:poly(A) polymerase Pap1